jgi:hypothetical protein
MFHKVRFTSPQYGHTAGLVLTAAQLKVRGFDPSRLFPRSDWPKMRTLQVSPAFVSWLEAFDYRFPV